MTKRIDTFCPSCVAFWKMAHDLDESARDSSVYTDSSLFLAGWKENGLVRCDSCSPFAQFLDNQPKPSTS